MMCRILHFLKICREKRDSVLQDSGYVRNTYKCKRCDKVQEFDEL